jgi:hypothetical protein
VIDLRTRRALSLAGGFAAVIGALAVLGTGSGLADHELRVCAAKQGKKLCVQLSDTPDPVAYSVFDGNSTWLSYQASMTNAGTSKLAKVRLKQTLPAGARLREVSSSRGECSGRPRRVVCKVGSLKKGKTVTADIVVSVPASTDPDPEDKTLESAATGSFRGSSGRGKRPAATYVETTTVSKSAGQTYVPAGASGKVGTDPDQSQYANSLIPNASVDVLAAIDVAPADDFCRDGQVKLHDRRYVCRDGGFVEASVTNAVTGETYSNPESPLVFHLSWDAPLVSHRQTVRNFVVFYQADDAAPVEVFCKRCNEPASNAPCLRNITQHEDGGFSVDLVKADNGRMR